MCDVDKRQEIESLLKEQEELHRNKSARKSFSQQQPDSEDTQRLRTLLGQQDMLKEELGKEKQCQNDIEKEVK